MNMMDIFSSKQISIDGKFIESYKKLKLEQAINDHHKFTLYLDNGVSDTINTSIVDQVKQWLGKTIVISSTGKDFVGIVTDISFEDSYDEDKYIVVKGYSSTILLEDGNKSQSWLGKTLSDIFKVVANNSRLTVKITPEHTDPIVYESQYAENNFHFIKRLCKLYYEWMFYDGEKLILGKPEKPEAKQLLIGIDIAKIKTHITTEARKSKSTSFSASNNDTYSAQSPDNVSGLNDLGDFAFKTSLDIYPEGHSEFPLARIPNQATLEKLMKRRQQSIASQTHYIEVTSTCKGLTVGSIIEIATADLLKKDKVQSKGKYIITEITHNIDFAEYYQNTFKALPADTAVLPEPEVEMPIAQVQMATVVSNDDPKKKGRVQVKMNWQSGDMKTSWIRVMTPDAGSSDSVSSNRGMVFIPEKGDQVLVGFRHNNPNRPFVFGSLFNGKSGGGGGSQNKTKSITTRSGNTVSLDDEKGNVTIANSKQDKIFIEGDGNKITITSGEIITIQTGKSSIKMTKDGTITLEGKTINLDSQDGSTNIKGADIIIDGTKKATLKSGSVSSVSAKEKDLEITVIGNIKSKSEGETTIEGKKVSIN